MLTPLRKALVVVARTHDREACGTEQCHERGDGQGTEKRPVDEGEAVNTRVEHHGPRKQEEECDGQERPGQLTPFAAHRIPTLHIIVGEQEQMITGELNIPSSTRGPTAEWNKKSIQMKRHNLTMRAYHSCKDECSIVHCRVRREFFYNTMKKLINPKRHRIEEDENGQLDADQNSEKVLYEDVNTSGPRTALDSTHRVHPQDIFRRTDAPKSLRAIHLAQVSKRVMFDGDRKFRPCKDARKGTRKSRAHLCAIQGRQAKVRKT